MAFEAETFAAALGAAKKQIALFLTSGATPKGAWDANTNTPTLVDGTGSLGWYYDVVVAGTSLGQSFLVGDRVMYNASNKWQRVATGVESESPMVVAFIDESSTLPTTRPSGKPLKLGDYCQVRTTATLPFDIGGIHIDNYGDKINWNGTTWQLQDYAVGGTNEIMVSVPTEETYSGAAQFQNKANKEFVEQIKGIIIEKDDLAVVATPEKRPYYQKTDTTARRKGLYWYNSNSTDTDKWELLGGIDVDDVTIKKNTEGKLQLKDGSDTDGIKVVKMNTNAISKDIPVDNTATDTKLATEKAVLDLVKTETLPITNKTIAIDSNYVIKTGLVEDKEFKVVSKKTTSGTVYFDFEEIAVPPTLQSFSCSPTVITSGTSTMITLAVKAKKGSKDLSRAVISYSGGSKEITGISSEVEATATVTISNGTAFSCIVYDTGGNASEAMTAYVSESSPTYTGSFGIVGGATTTISGMTSNYYANDVTLASQRVFYQFPKALGALSSITANGEQVLAVFTRTESGNDYVYTSNDGGTGAFRFIFS